MKQRTRRFVLFDFFFDSADVEFISSTWDKIKHVVNPSYVRGVTTNPKAMHRVNCHKLEQWRDKTLELCKLITKIRGDNKGVVYVQFPNCNASKKDAIKFAKEIAGWGDGQTRIGMKIPPYKDILSIVPVLEKYVETNVTGVADAGTALFAASHDVRYVSIIPGRMEEKGINSDSHLFLTTNSNLQRTEIIAGSMRTIDGLHRSVILNTVPTIGSTVFKLILEDPERNLRVERGMGNIKFNDYSTGIDNHALSRSFFVEMNQLATTAYLDFKLKEK